MNKTIFYSLPLLLISNLSLAQSEKIYATTDLAFAKQIKEKFPKDVDIISTNDNHAAVYMTTEAADHLHHNVITHGPGYVYKSTKEEAVNAINVQKRTKRILEFTIDQSSIVNNAISKVSADNIKNHIQILENYGTRRHTTTQAQTAVQDLKTKWEGLIAASGRSDLSVRIVNHVGTPMPSLVFTITGSINPDEYVIVGGHLDTITSNNSAIAPGADDDASGIATITEMLRVLLDINYKPAKTVEFMAFSAEEIGLVGSSEIAKSYSQSNKNVLAFVQFDMVNYKGSSKDVYLTTDPYNSNNLNLFLIELMEYYNKTGSHTFNYGNTICNYGCSDHFSFASNGYEAAFPFESSFTQYNPSIHTSNDKLVNMGNNANHAAKFAKLGLEFIIETAKSNMLSVSEMAKNSIEIGVKNKILSYKLGTKVASVAIYDISGKSILERQKLLSVGQINLTALTTGFYLAVFKAESGEVTTKKFLIE